MYASHEPLFVLPDPPDLVELQISSALRSGGYLVIKSFDLHSAIQNHKNCECKTDTCDCQKAILLVYSNNGAPITLMLDGNEFETAVYIITDSNQLAYSVSIKNILQQFPNTLLAINPLDSLT